MGRREKLIKALSDLDFRRQFVSAQVRRFVSGQIRTLRDVKRWTQGELGQRAAMKQNAISRIEDPDYGDFTINTLLRLAAAFDVGLIVRFVPFSELVGWNQKISPKEYCPPSFSEDRGLRSFPKDDAFLRPRLRPIPTAVSSQPSAIQHLIPGQIIMDAHLNSQDIGVPWQEGQPKARAYGIQ